MARTPPKHIPTLEEIEIAKIIIRSERTHVQSSHNDFETGNVRVPKIHKMKVRSQPRSSQVK